MLGRRRSGVGSLERRRTSASSVSRRGRRCAAWRWLGLDERRPGWLRVAERKLRARAIGLESTVEGGSSGGELSGERRRWWRGFLAPGGNGEEGVGWLCCMQGRGEE